MKARQTYCIRRFIFAAAIVLILCFFFAPITLNIILGRSADTVLKHAHELDLTSEEISFSLDYKNIFTHTTISRPEMLSAPPESGYPVYSSLLSLVSNWNPDEPEPPAIFKETIQIFNYSNKLERSYAEKFRNAELPFKLYGVPDILKVANKWNDKYLIDKMKSEHAHVEESKTNHFMYWNGQRDKGLVEFTPPTNLISMKFGDWLGTARKADKEKLENDTTHYYFMTGTSANDNLRSYISQDLPIFSTRKNNFFVTNTAANKGIQCRFGMRGIIAEAHYDSGRNMVAMIKGAKRYILNPPRMCKMLGIISDMKHPSYRHSVIDWSDIEQAKSKGFDKVDAIDTIVQTGEVLYIPSYWFHYIVSLKYSVQCNTRSGSPPNSEGQEDIDLCLGYTPKKW